MSAHDKKTNSSSSSSSSNNETIDTAKPTEKSSGGTTSLTPPKNKAPRLVRFPFDNNPDSKRVHMPADEESIEAQSDPFAPSHSQHTTRPIGTPPINIDFADGRSFTLNAGEYSDEEQQQKPPVSTKNKNESKISSFMNRKNTRNAGNENLKAHIPDDARSSIFDIGLITSGGLAPGSGGGESDNRILQPRYDNRRHQNDLESSLHGLSENSNGIPLRELDRKLSKYASSKTARQVEQEGLDNDNDEERRATSFARNLVLEHSRYLSSRPPSPGAPVEVGMTVPVSSYFDQANGDDCDNEGRPQDNEDTDIADHGHILSNDSRQDNLVELGGDEVQQDGTITPRHEDYIPAPAQVRQGVLGSLLKLYGHSHTRQSSSTTLFSGDVSGATTPLKSSFDDGTRTPTILDHKFYNPLGKKWGHKSKSGNTSVSDLVSSSAQTLMIPGEHPEKEKKAHRPKYLRRQSAMDAYKKSQSKKRKQEEQAAITIHIADVLQRQRFILRLCRALMLFGAPTHRLEEYMKMTSRVLGIDGQFLYIPGCMIISFGDSSTHTSEMQLVRCVQGVNLHKLDETHTIYKEVIHGHKTVDEASTRLEEVLLSKNLYPPWLCVLFFGFSSLAVGPFAFGGRWLDMPISFFLGTLVGVLQIVVAPRSALYNNVFEVSASIIVSFLGRAFGSIGGHTRDIFCFAAITQSALALILPGYIILCGSLELQSRSIVAGSVRMFYAIIYSLFLGFGITLGAAIYGWMDKNATSTLTCPHPVNDWWRVLFVPLFTLGLALVNQAHWKRLPVQVMISCGGYVVTYFSNKRLSNASELTSAIGAFVIGILGNMYSRVGHGLAFAAMLPSIFVLVPSGVASQGSLISGINTANSIVTNSTETSDSTSGTSVAALGITMVQVSIGITVGLFVATLAIYPFGKKKTGLFTF